MEEPDHQGNKDQNAPVKSGTYTLPCGMELQFYDSVHNDVTGNWRRAATSDSFVPTDYALEYYQAMFSSDSEIHAVWNTALGTTTRIRVSGSDLDVTTMEYVEGEELDAKLLFSGTVLNTATIDIQTGKGVMKTESVEPEADDSATTGEKNALRSAQNGY